MRQLWAVRVLEAEKLLAAGHGAIFFDADAIWQTDVVTLLTAMSTEATETNTATPPPDVVASRGRFPHNIEKVWGATVCMGLIYFAPTPGAAALLRAMRHYIDPDPAVPFDDQIAINRALMDEAGVRWGGGKEAGR